MAQHQPQNEKRARGEKHEALEAALWTWFQQVKCKLRLFSTVAEITWPWPDQLESDLFKARRQPEADELSALIAALQLGDDALPVDDRADMVGEQQILFQSVDITALVLQASFASLLELQTYMECYLCSAGGGAFI